MIGYILFFIWFSPAICVTAILDGLCWIITGQSKDLLWNDKIIEFPLHFMKIHEIGDRLNKN
jgi:hypothetical protein